VISVNLIDKFVPLAPPPAAEHDAPRSRPAIEFGRSLNDASNPPVPKPKPEPRPARPSADQDPSEHVDEPVADAAPVAEPAPTQNAQSESAATPADAPVVEHASPQAAPVAQPVTGPVTGAPIIHAVPFAQTPAALTPSPIPTPPVNNAPSATTTLSPPTPVTLPALDQIQPEGRPVAEAIVPLIPDAADPPIPLPRPVGASVSAPGQQQTKATRTTNTTFAVDDAEAPDPQQPPRPPSIDDNPTRVRPLAPDAPGGDAPRDAATRQQVRQHHVDAAAARDTRTPDLQAPTPFPAQSAGGATSPAVEHAKALLPEAGLNEFPAPAAVGPVATNASSAALAAPSALEESNGSSQVATIRGATVLDAHDSGGGFRLDAGGPAAPASPVDRLTQVLSSSVTPRSSFLRLQLEPPELGQLRIEVRMNQDVLSMRVQAETSAVKGLIEERMGELKAAMHQQGIRVDRVDVDVKPQSPSSHGREHGDARDPGTREQAAAWDRPRDTGDWRHAPDDPRTTFDGDIGPVEGALAPQAANDFHLVTTESSVDVLI
jgi:hypothetical protein